MEKVRLGLVGCGMMGTRHLFGYEELAKTPFNNVELCALCDISRDNVELAATEVENLMGYRPEVFTDLEEMTKKVPDLQAVDVVTDPSVHHDVVCAALDLGLHVMVEKPMAITVKACQKMIEAAERNGRILSVAENYRRDPSTRLVHHLLKSDAIGSPYMGLYQQLSPGNYILATPWRHLKERGGLLLDLGVHFTDLIRYQLGEIEEVYGDARMIEPTRKKRENANPGYAFLRNLIRDMDDEIEAKAEDTTTAMFKMESGVMVHWMVGISGHAGVNRELIFGDRGSIEGFGARGSRVSIKKVDGSEMSQEEILESVDGFEQDPLSAHLFPTAVTAGDKAVDRKILAFEQHELADAVLNGSKVEVDGIEGMKDVAAVYAIFESAVAGRAVKMSEVESCQAYDYQAEIDEVLGIV